VDRRVDLQSRSALLPTFILARPWRAISAGREPRAASREPRAGLHATSLEPRGSTHSTTRNPQHELMIDRDIHSRPGTRHASRKRPMLNTPSSPGHRCGGGGTVESLRKAISKEEAVLRVDKNATGSFVNPRPVGPRGCGGRPPRRAAASDARSRSRRSSCHARPVPRPRRRLRRDPAPWRDGAAGSAPTRFGHSGRGPGSAGTTTCPARRGARDLR